ncbi:hypothetical protein MY3296_008958 [Beauveria thailandica]
MADLPIPAISQPKAMNKRLWHSLLTNQPEIRSFRNDTVNEKDPRPPTAFVSEERCNEYNSCGIMPRTGAAGSSSAGIPRAKALQRLMPEVKIEDTDMGVIKFGSGNVSTKVIVKVNAELGCITFKVIEAATSFLISITGMDELKIKLDNLENFLIQGRSTFPVVRKWGHPWLLIDTIEKAAFMLTDVQLRHLHRRFVHPSVPRLRLLERASEKYDPSTLKKINEICHDCQINGPTPERFKFNMKDDHELNYEIIVDIFYIKGRPVLHIVDSTTAFQAARSLEPTGQKTRDVFNAIKECWIDTYIEIITHEAPVEADNSVGKVERYYGILRRAYEILDEEAGNEMTAAQKLQAAVKAVNNSAGPNGLVLTLLKGRFRLLSQDGETCTVAMPRGPADFRTVAVKPHLHPPEEPAPAPTDPPTGQETGTEDKDNEEETVVERGGEAPASTNVPKENPREKILKEPAIMRQSSRKDRGQNHRNNPKVMTFEVSTLADLLEMAYAEGETLDENFFVSRDQSDRKISEELRAKCIITAPGAPFEASRGKEFAGLLLKKVFEFILFNKALHGGMRIFDARMVDEVKGKGRYRSHVRSHD